MLRVRCVAVAVSYQPPDALLPVLPESSSFTPSILSSMPEVLTTPLGGAESGRYALFAHGHVTLYITVTKTRAELCTHLAHVLADTGEEISAIVRAVGRRFRPALIHALLLPPRCPHQLSSNGL